jgi:hypothetical protein
MTTDKMKTDGFTASQRAVLVALLDQRTVVGAAKVAGVARSTVYRWLDKPEFKAEVGRLRRRFFEEGLDLINAGMAKAVGRLLEALDDTNRHVRLRAAQATVQLGLELRQGVEMEARLDELERQALLLEGRK